MLVPPYQSTTLKPRQLHGAEKKFALQRAKTLPKIELNLLQQGDLFMLGLGAFTPLTGFMDHDDWYSVCQSMALKNGTLWPIPITLSVSKQVADSLKPPCDVALIDSKKTVLGILHCQTTYQNDHKFEAKKVFSTQEKQHPGVALLYQQGNMNLSGDVDVISFGKFSSQFSQLLLSPQQTRDYFIQHNWQLIAAFQTRNPMHRAHEHIVKLALQQCDGVLIHSILGQLKPDDIPASIATDAIAQLIKHYFKSGSVLQAGYPMTMRYAGPREAILHAIFRQNYGCSHLVVGRDHAGVSQYYSPYAAQEIFKQIPQNALHIKPLFMDATFWCHCCDGMATERDCPHSESERLSVSGTQLRELLQNQLPIPTHFSRAEVLAILKKFYKELR